MGSINPPMGRLGKGQNRDREEAVLEPAKAQRSVKQQSRSVILALDQHSEYLEGTPRQKGKADFGRSETAYTGETRTSGYCPARRNTIHLIRHAHFRDHNYTLEDLLSIGRRLRPLGDSVHRRDKDFG